MSRVHDIRPEFITDEVMHPDVRAEMSARNQAAYEEAVRTGRFIRLGPPQPDLSPAKPNPEFVRARKRGTRRAGFARVAPTAAGATA